MEAFWLLAGVLSTCAALFVLLPWLRTVPRIGPLPSVSWSVVAAAAVVLAAVVGLYVKLGRPELLARSGSTAGGAPMPASTGADSMAGAGAAGSAALKSGVASNGGAGSMASAIANLQGRLAKGGGSADDWELLAKSYEFLGQPADAARARARQLPSLPATALLATADSPAAPPVSAAPVLSAQSLKLLAQASAARRDKKLAAAAAIYFRLAAANQMSADAWADYADTAAALQGNRLAGAPSDYIARSLALDPQHPKALWLQASADEELGHWKEAIADWQRLLAVLEPNSSDARLVAANLQHDTTLAGVATPAASLATGPTVAGAAGPAMSAASRSGSAIAAGAASGIAVRGEVTVAPALRARVRSGITLFIVAKSVDSPGVPVAVYRGVTGAWPVKFTLDDSQAMMPGRTLSNAGRVTIEARISSSGQAMPSSGDLSGSSGVVMPSAGQQLQIQIDREIP